MALHHIELHAPQTSANSISRLQGNAAGQLVGGLAAMQVGLRQNYKHRKSQENPQPSFFVVLPQTVAYP